jgi:glycine dehydrogenase
MMGSEGITKATKMALLNANYMAERLAPHYSILYRGEVNGRIAHEFIIDLRQVRASVCAVAERARERLRDKDR